jgi:hypothetical protein
MAAKQLKLNYQNAKAIVRKAKFEQSYSDTEDVRKLPCENIVMGSAEDNSEVRH